MDEKTILTGIDISSYDFRKTLDAIKNLGENMKSVMMSADAIDGDVPAIIISLERIPPAVSLRKTNCLVLPGTRITITASIDSDGVLVAEEISMEMPWSNGPVSSPVTIEHFHGTIHRKAIK